MKNAPSNAKSVLIDKDTSAHTQRNQIVALIKQYQSMNTPEFRENGIMAPAPRIFELRKMGMAIDKVLETYIDNTGKTHHGVARYYFPNKPPAHEGMGKEIAA
ncbi:helix-turn-helix domain-containing protein [Alteromonas oceanisediminis]|uniref:helix-turn-helix domain-containing protein n=1 Tax=Alteromonas oceanisediminis TaxID=2836180 RepID=UPI001BDAB35A|nr:helix-turn-helix domain-containing protein [Alteromonas oceanisediminis]MBT0585113.1 hypothetical protein [Alteromonas oceanisediminis]